MRRFWILITLQCALIQIYAQIPNGYYSSADGYCGASLKTALYKIINAHTALSYDALWDAFKTTDRRDDGKVWDMYSSSTNFVFGTDQAGNYKKEGDVYNREHSFPKSWFSEARPMYTDLFHLYPTDGYVNGRRSNYPFGETDNPTYTSNGGFSKLGPSSTPGYSGVVFEPADEYKGDFARTYFYMATCYENQIANWSCDMLAGNSYPAYKEWALNMLLRWAEEDPVSEKEINRNNEVYKLQKNRNPFIDFPGLEEYIWGDKMDVLFDSEDYDSETGDATVMAPVFSPASGTVSKGTNIQITTGTPGAQIVYTLNGGAEVQVTNPVNLTLNETATITAYAVLNDTKSQPVTATYTVSETGGSTPSISGAWTFTPVTSASDLTPGAQYLIVCEELSVAMAAQDQSKDIRSYATVSFDNGLIHTEVNGQNQPYTFVLGGTAGQYTFYDATGNCYLSLNKSDNKLQTTTDGESKNAQWNITFENEGTQIISCAYNTRSIQYNSGFPRFACYTTEKSNQKGVTLYKLQSVNFSITACGYATYYGDQPFYLPAGLQAGAITGLQAADNKLTIDWLYQGGSVVPSETGVIIKGAAGNYTCKISQTDAEKPATNWLKGSTENAETEGTDCLFYKLATDTNQPVGFYWGTENGGAFMNTAHKAYLTVPTTTSNKISYITLEKPTGIQQILNKKVRLVNVYSISGTLIRKQIQERGALDGLPAGLYLINGRKVLK